MLKHKLLISFLILVSGSANAQTSPFDKKPNNEEVNAKEVFVTDREMRQNLQQLRMDLEMMIMNNPQFEQELPSPNASILGDLGEDAKLKIIINGKNLKRDNEKYSISEH